MIKPDGLSVRELDGDPINPHVRRADAGARHEHEHEFVAVGGKQSAVPAIS